MCLTSRRFVSIFYPFICSAVYEMCQITSLKILLRFSTQKKATRTKERVQQICKYEVSMQNPVIFLDTSNE